MVKKPAGKILISAIVLICITTGCISHSPSMKSMLQDLTLDYTSQPDPDLQAWIEDLDAKLRGRFGMTTNDTAVGLLDLRSGKLAMVWPDREEYAASVPKIGILLAYFALRPECVTNMDSQTRNELGLMAKISNNEMAAKYSRELGLTNIQKVLNDNGFYDASRGGGLWVGKHYGKSDERYGSPVGDNSHAATVRQLLRFYLLLEQGKLVSPQASAQMRKIFESPDIPHDPHKFVKGLEGRDVSIIRKWGSWENWQHDTAVVAGKGRHYILVALTHHAKGDDYLEALAREVDQLADPANTPHGPQAASKSVSPE